MKTILWAPGSELQILEDLITLLLENKILTKEQVKLIPHVIIKEAPAESEAPVDTVKES